MRPSHHVAIQTLAPPTGNPLVIGDYENITTSVLSRRENAQLNCIPTATATASVASVS